jgi:hypothetical protein
MQLVPNGVVNATSSPSGVVVPPRSATRKSAPSTGPAASTQPIASATGAPGAGAGADDDDDVPGWPVLVVGTDPAARDGVIGVSWVARGGVPDICEHPATSSDAANNTATRIRQG